MKKYNSNTLTFGKKMFANYPWNFAENGGLSRLIESKFFDLICWNFPEIVRKIAEMLQILVGMRVDLLKFAEK